MPFSSSMISGQAEMDGLGAKLQKGLHFLLEVLSQSNRNPPKWNRDARGKELDLWGISAAYLSHCFLHIFQRGNNPIYRANAPSIDFHPLGNFPLRNIGKGERLQWVFPYSITACKYPKQPWVTLRNKQKSPWRKAAFT